MAAVLDQAAAPVIDQALAGIYDEGGPMAGWVTTVLNPIALNATPTSGTMYTGGAPSAGYDTGTGTFTAWSSNNVVFVPNASGNVILWYYCGATAAGVAQVLVGEQLTGKVLPATTAKTIAATEEGWFGPFSPATYNIQDVTNIPASVAGSPAGNMPAAAAGCFAVAFTTTTTLSVRAYSFGHILP
jgi:hypothetical protein